MLTIEEIKEAFLESYKENQVNHYLETKENLAGYFKRAKQNYYHLSDVQPKAAILKDLQAQKLLPEFPYILNYTLYAVQHDEVRECTVNRYYKQNDQWIVALNGAEDVPLSYCKDVLFETEEAALERRDFLREKKKNGYNFNLPCNVGDTVYYFTSGIYSEVTVPRAFTIAQIVFRENEIFITDNHGAKLALADFGKNIFYTPEEAKEAADKLSQNLTPNLR